MWDFIWLNHKNSCSTIKLWAQEDAVKCQGYEVQATVQFVLAMSSMSAIHLLVIVGDYLVRSLLLWRVRSTVASPSESSHPTLRRSKNRRKLSSLFQSLQQMSVTSQQSHAPRQSRKWVRERWSVPFSHRPALGHCATWWKIILEVMLQLYKLLIKK